MIKISCGFGAETEPKEAQSADKDAPTLDKKLLSLDMLDTMDILSNYRKQKIPQKRDLSFTHCEFAKAMISPKAYLNW